MASDSLRLPMQLAQPLLALDQRQAVQVLAVLLEQVEGEEGERRRRTRAHP